MARRYLADMRPGDLIEDEVFVVGKKELRPAKNGSLYMALVVGDKSARMPAKIWQASETLYKQIPSNGYLRLRGRIEEYGGDRQMIIDGFRPVDLAAVAIADLLPCTTKDVEGMWRRTLEILRTIQNKDILLLLKQFIADEEFCKAFKRWPAGVSLHHAYLGGLLEHTLNLMELAVAILPQYPQLNADLVLAAIFLHDIGKIRELTADAVFEYTDDGQLVGHIVQTTIWIEEKAMQAARESGRPFPADLKRVLQHIALASHGTPEYGSPRLPATAEAAMVHYLDQMDAKIHAFCASIEDCKDESSHWTEYKRHLSTRVYRGSFRTPPA